MQYKFYVGIDVSKLTLDVALIDERHREVIEHIQVSNDDEGIGQMLNWLNTHEGFQIEQTMFCMEATGLYCYPLLQFLHLHQAATWVENAIQIKRSLGIQRGKNDKVDAKRIAQYAFKNREQVRLWQPRREVVEQLKQLAALRERLVETRKRLLTPVNEFRQYGNEAMAKMLEKSMSKSIKAIEKDIDGVEQKLKDIINGDDDLKKIFNLATSVIGIGFVTAINLIIHTNEFKMLTDVRKLACYCGIAPFEYSSGSSIRGKRRVHPMANRKLKTNLHMGSLTGVKLDPGLKAYYERKVAQGKNKMSVLNAVKNKLIARVLAVIKRGEPYQKNYSPKCLAVS
jgi:transposase